MKETPTPLYDLLGWPLKHSTWLARSVVWPQGQRVDIPTLAQPLGFTVPVTLSEVLRVELQSAGEEFRPHLEELLRQVYRILHLSQTEDVAFRFRPRQVPLRADLWMVFGAAPGTQALNLQTADEIGDEEIPLDPASREAQVPPDRYHYLERPLHSAIQPTPPIQAADPDAAPFARPG